MTEPRRALPTQSAHPWRATVRTIVAVILGLSIVLPLVWGIAVEELARQGWTVPAPVATVVAIIIGVVAVVTGIITRVMAIPQVDGLLRLIGLSAAPKVEPTAALFDPYAAETDGWDDPADEDSGMPD